MLRQRLHLRRECAVPRNVAGGISPAVVSHSMAGGTPALRGILGGPAPRRENIPRPSFAASGLKNRTAAGFLLPEKTSRRRTRVAPGLFDPWDQPCHTPQCFMAAGLEFPLGHFIPLQEPLWTLPLSLAAVSCKSHLSKVSLHPSILKIPSNSCTFRGQSVRAALPLIWVVSAKQPYHFFDWR